MTRSLKIDLHVHTAKYSPCAECLQPADLLAAAARAGLAGVVVTDHDVLWAAEEVVPLQQKVPEVRLYRGTECTVQGAHLVVIGLDDAAHLYRGMPFRAAMEIVRASGAAAILAHPFRGSDLAGLPISLVHAVEVASTSFTAAEAVRAWRLARRLGKPAVAGSDAHALSLVGWAWTSFPFLPEDEMALAAAIKSGLGKPGRKGRFRRHREVPRGGAFARRRQNRPRGR